jgi:hypothetical protein
VFREISNESLDGQHESGLAGDVVQQGQAGPRCHPAQHRVHDILLRLQWKGDIRHNDARSRALGDEIQRVAAGVVFVVGDQQFITAFESQRAQHGVDTGGGIWHEDQALRVRAEEFCQLTASFVEQRFQVADEELDRLAFETVANLSLILEHNPRAGSERAMVQVNHLWVEGPKPRVAGGEVQRRSMNRPVVARASRPCVGRAIRTGETPVPLFRTWASARLIGSPHKPGEHRRDRPAR